MSSHIYVQPQDGLGFVSLFKDGLPRWTGEPDDSHLASPSSTDEPASEKLDLRCHCGRWSATLNRPPSAADPDPFKAYRARAPRWRMTCCACETCQRTTGYPFSCYFSVPKSALSSTTDDSALTKIRSSAEVDRWFCPGCGASVYYQRAETRKHDCISVFAGTADATLAQVFQHWVWREEMLFPEEGERELVSTLLDSWNSD